jgi:Rieske 2Fe-2S family protein
MTSLRLDELAQTHTPGHSLVQDFYTRADVYHRDLDLLLGRWICVGHTSEIPETGDWITAELGAESAIIVRGEDGVVRALANVCRHRGSRVCVEARGSGAVLVCPYHAWTYRLDGGLRSAREMPPGFDPAAHALQGLPLRIVGGLIFISFALDPPDLQVAAEALSAMTDHYGWSQARIAERRTYTVAANWKLAMENYHECYHCGPAHPEFAVLHALARPNVRRLRTREDSERDLAAGRASVPDVERWAEARADEELVRVMHSSLAEDVQSGAAQGALVAPIMGEARAEEGACVFAEVGYLSAFLAYADHGVIYRFIPRGPLSTEMEVLWLVDAGAQAGVDYRPQDLTWLWDVTSQSDKTIIERNQAGVLSRHYRPGPFSLMEPGAQAYVERYVRDFSHRAAKGE